MAQIAERIFFLFMADIKLDTVPISGVETRLQFQSRRHPAIPSPTFLNHTASIDVQSVPDFQIDPKWVPRS